MNLRKQKAVLLAASAAVLALGAAGCGGTGGPSRTSGPNANPNLEKAVKFTQCMREHGVPKFPDPDKNGKYSIAAGGTGASQQQVDRARQACKALEPPGFEPSAAERQKDQEEWLKWAQCMRRNGIRDMPDPQGGKLKVPRDRIDVNTPQFKRALKTCDRGGAANGNG